MWGLPKRCLQEMGRIFCPRCGNATLDKVQVGLQAAALCPGAGTGDRTS